MKFTKEQKERMKDLVLKGAALTEVEKAEKATLIESAKAAKYEFNETTGEAIEAMTADDVKALVAGSVASAMGDLGLSAEVVRQIKESLAAQGDVSAEAITKAIKEAVGGQVDTKALAAAIEAKMPKDFATTEGVKTLLADFQKTMLESTRRASKMVFPEDVSAPIQSRGGNLSVGQKQLLNLCLTSVSEEALQNSDGGRGIVRPKSMNDGITAEQLSMAVRAGEQQVLRMRKQASFGRKALTSTGSGTGDEFVATDLSSELMSRLYLNSDLAAAMIANEINMPSNPFMFPLVTTRPTFRKGAENPGSSPAASDPGTAAITLTASKLIGICQYSYEADEDSIIAILPFLQEQMGLSAAEALEEALVNGDTTGTHMDSDTHAVGATAAQKLFKGLRKMALIAAAADSNSSAVSFATGGISAANISALRKAMGKWGIRPQELMLLCGPKGYNDIVQLDETLTQDKVGGAARILTGIAPQIYGIPVIVSSAVRENLNATGVYDGSTTTKGSILMVHKPSFLLGVRRGFTVETDVDKAQQLNSVIASFRRDFQPKETVSKAVPMVALGYNYDA